MGDLLDKLGNKAAGQLIRSQDWNALVAALEKVRDDLGARIDTLEQSVDARLSAAETELARVGQVITQVVQPYLAGVYRVTLQAPRTRFAIGEPAELTAKVTDAAGRPLDLADPNQRPWVDFVAAWGQLRPVPGFVTLDDASADGDRSISVQVNAQGEAKVRLGPDHIEGLGVEVESGIAAALKARATPTAKIAADTFLEASTPTDAAARASFKMMSLEYDRDEASAVRSFADSYFVRNSARVTGAITVDFVDRWRQTWRDYRSVVVAFAKSDADPLSADSARGSASIQITFRDWIGPWIVTDYIPSFVDLVPPLKEKFKLKIKPDFTESLIGMKDEIDGTLAGKGVIGKMRSYSGVREAISRMDPAGLPAFLPDLAQAVGGAVSLQQSVEAAQTATAGVMGQTSAYSVVLSSSARSDRKTTELEAKVGKVSSQVRTEVADAVKTEVGAITSAGGVIGGLESKIREIDSRVKTFGTAVGDVAVLQGKLEKVVDLDADLKTVRDRVSRLER